MRSKITDSFIDKQRQRKHPYIIDTLGFEMRVDTGVYPPSEDSTLLAEQLQEGHYKVQPGEYVLDFGTGTGYFALVSARAGGKVVAIDHNLASIECARYNTQKHGLDDKIDFRLGKSFEAIKSIEKFDMVAASLPFESATPLNMFEASVYDKGFETRREFFTRIQQHLSQKGRILYAYADYAESVAPIAQFLDGFDFDIIAERKSSDGELNRVYIIKPK